MAGKAFIFVTVVIMILSLPGQNLSTLVANATEEVEEEEHLASSGSAGKYPELTGDTQF